MDTLQMVITSYYSLGKIPTQLKSTNLLVTTRAVRLHKATKRYEAVHALFVTSGI
jgi:hypothetical protein